MSPPIDPNLPPLTPPNAPRVAEATDARLPIREHEEQAKRKKEQGQKKETVLPEDSYDQSVLAVRPLIDFLKNFLQGSAAAPSGTSAAFDGSVPPVPVSDATAGEAAGPPVALPVSASGPEERGMAARAALAYRHSAEAGTTTRGARAGLSQIGTGPSAPVDLLENAEVRQIHDVIALLETLEQRGVPGLRLTRAETFVTAIENAARGALSALI